MRLRARPRSKLRFRSKLFFILPLSFPITHIHSFPPPLPPRSDRTASQTRPSTKKFNFDSVRKSSIEARCRAS